jgi:outer membrane receptor protein involved in Fe transport
LLYATVLCFAQAAAAQVPTATILGVVQDASGAVLPGSTVTAKNVETGLSRSVTSGPDGRYRIAQLGLGDYEVQVQMTGFETAVRSGITLTLGREAVVDVTMQVGAVTETVSVTGEAPLVETTTSSVAQLVDENSIALLPLNGRDLTQLATLQAGVSLSVTAGTSTTGGPGKKISIAGARPSQSSYLLDGMDIMNNSGKGVSGVSGELLGLDSVQEFAVMSSNYTAEYSRSAGGVINVVTKAGTNTLHGSAFEFIRNDNLDARQFFDSEKPEFKRNQFGASLGGPIRRDRAFYFANYEGFREIIGNTARPFVPTAEARAGILHAPERVVAPNQSIVPLLRLWPQPSPDGLISTDGNSKQYITIVNVTTNENYLTGRVDYALSPTDNLFVRYTFDNGTKETPTAILPVLEELALRGQYTTIQWTKIIGNSLINSLRLGGNRTRWAGNTDGPVEELRFYPNRAIGSIAVGSGISSIGGSTNQPFEHPITVIDYADDVNYTKDRHAMKFGFLGRKYLWGFERDFRGNGGLSYTDWEQFLRNSAQSFTGIGPGSADTRRHYRQSQFGFYIQDDFRATPSVTLNFGLRYEFITNPTEATGPRIAIIPSDWDERDLVNGVLVDNVFEKNPSLKNFSPRFGFAWDLFGNGKTAVRGGWALLFDQIYPLYYENQRNPPLFLTVDIRPSSYPNPFSGVASAPLSPVAMDYYNTHTPSVMQYNLAVQQEMAAGTVLNLSFVGARSYHLPVANDVNTRIPDILSDGTMFWPASRPFRNPNWGRASILEWTGQGFYNSLQIGLNKRFNQGFQVRGNYTWSRNVDDGSGTIGADFENATLQRQNPYDPKSDRGLASHHVGHVLNASYVLDLPFGPGRAYAGDLTGWAAKVLEGWQFQGIVTARSGPPLTATLGSFDRSRSGNQADRPNLKPGASIIRFTMTGAGSSILIRMRSNWRHRDISGMLGGTQSSAPAC